MAITSRCGSCLPKRRTEFGRGATEPALRFSDNDYNQIVEHIFDHNVFLAVECEQTPENKLDGAFVKITIVRRSE